ncbi:MAG: hypothetical protein ACE5HY_03230 [Candidatus Hydrothermarchaeales archaeon]
MTQRDAAFKMYKKAGLILLVLLLVATSSLGYLFHSYRNSQKHLAALRSELYNTGQELQSTKEEMWSIQWDLQAFKKELSSAREDLNASEARLRSLSDKLKETETRLKETEIDLKAAETKLDETLSRLNGTESVLRAAQTELTTEKERTDRLKAEKENLEDDLGQLTRNTILNREVLWSDNFSPYSKWSYTLRVNRVNYLFYVTSTHPFDIDYRRIDDFITPQDSSIRDISGTLADHYVGRKNLAEHVLAFVQSLPYEGDMDEYPKYPLETLVEGGGDCEDTSILYAALMKALGYDVALLDFKDHVMVGVAFRDPVPASLIGKKSFDHNGRRYYTAETTEKYWRIGEILEEYEKKEAAVYPV